MIPWALAERIVFEGKRAIGVQYRGRDGKSQTVRAGRDACRRYELQFLDDTVSFARLRVARDDEGRLKILRTYTFEFTETGNTRRHGAIVMLGQELRDIQLEPYRVQ